MLYKYHAQPQAEDYAAKILPVPKDYPLKEGLDDSFRKKFSDLCEVMKKVYLDMAKSPESYGVMLLDIYETDGNEITSSRRSLKKLVDILYDMAVSSEYNGSELVVDIEKFKKATKTKFKGLTANKVSGYAQVLSRLTLLGFNIKGFNGIKFEKDAATFALSYPQNRDIVEALKIFCDCRMTSWEANTRLKFNIDTYDHNFYRFDYKFTSDMDKIPMEKWIEDYTYFWDETLKTFYMEFYRYSQNYRDIDFRGEYFIKNYRFARRTENAFTIKLKSINNYSHVIDNMPERIKKIFRESTCRHCADGCKYTIRWTFEDKRNENCAFNSFVFTDLDPEDIPFYYSLIEKEYNLARN